MELYRGGFKKDIYHGYGVLRHSNGSIMYEGEYHNGLRHGKGTLYLENGDTYSGMFRHNKYHGMGLLMHQNGQVLEGEFVDGTFCDSNNKNASNWLL